MWLPCPRSRSPWIHGCMCLCVLAPTKYWCLGVGVGGGRPDRYSLFDAGLGAVPWARL